MDERNKYFREWREKNAGKVNEYRQTKLYVKITCELCGKEMMKNNLLRHKKNSHPPWELS
jgi:hypothetical protein